MPAGSCGACRPPVAVTIAGIELANVAAGLAVTTESVLSGGRHWTSGMLVPVFAPT